MNVYKGTQISDIDTIKIKSKIKPVPHGQFLNDDWTINRHLLDPSKYSPMHALYMNTFQLVTHLLPQGFYKDSINKANCYK